MTAEHKENQLGSKRVMVIAKRMEGIFEQIRGGLIVSCQAGPDEPLHGALHMAAMAKAAAEGGAAGIRASGFEDIAAIRKVVHLPIFGLIKDDIPGYSVRITPTIDHARRVAEAGADIIAIDATDRPHPDGLTLIERIQRIHSDLCLPVLADISNYREGIAADKAGADCVATTLSGYTSDHPAPEEPDLSLVKELAVSVHIPVIAEGRFATTAQVCEALGLGACAVVVGTAITRPQWITRQFVAAIQNLDLHQ